MPEKTQYFHHIQPTRPAMLLEGSRPEKAAITSQHFEYLKDLTERRIIPDQDE